MGQRGDHASSFIIEMDTAAQQRSTNLVSSQCLNILDWVTSPRKYAKGQNFQYHLKAVNRFLSNINAPTEYHLAILVNSLDEECQLELYSHPEYNYPDWVAIHIQDTIAIHTAHIHTTTQSTTHT